MGLKEWNRRGECHKERTNEMNILIPSYLKVHTSVPTKEVVLILLSRRSLDIE